MAHRSRRHRPAPWRTAVEGSPAELFTKVPLRRIVLWDEAAAPTGASRAGEISSVGRHQQAKEALSGRAKGLIAPYTAGKVSERRDGQVGHCRTCGRGFRISMDEFIRHHGAARPVVGIAPYLLELRRQAHHFPRHSAGEGRRLAGLAALLWDPAVRLATAHADLITYILVDIARGRTGCSPSNHSWVGISLSTASLMTRGHLSSQYKASTGKRMATP